MTGFSFISGVFLFFVGPFSYYINPENIEELRYAIDTVLHNSMMRQEMITKGLEYAQQFNDDKIASQWNGIYQSLI